MKERILNNPLIFLTMRLWRSSEGRRSLVALYMLMSAISMGFQLATPLIMAELLNAAQAAAYEGQMRYCAWLLVAVVFMGVGMWLFHGPSRVIEQVGAFCARRDLQSELLIKVTKLPVRWHHAHHSGETIDRVGRASQSLGDFATETFQDLGVVTRYVGSILLLSYFMPLAGLFIVAATLVTLGTVLAFDRKLVPLYEESNRRTNKVAAAVQDYLTNVTTVISLRLEDRVVREVNGKMDVLRPLYRKTAIMNETKWFSANVLVDVTRVSVLMAYLWSTLGHGKQVEIGTLYALKEYLSSIGNSFFMFTWRYGDWVLKATKLRAIDFISEDFEREVGPAASAKLPQGWRELQLKGLRFSHVVESGTPAGLFGVDLQLERGKSYALIGESGSGKSTLLSVLRGIQQAQEGAVFCDGELVEHGMAAVSHHTTLIPQEPEIFADTVLFNVSMGIEAPEGAVSQALHMARFADVLKRLPRGLETNIAEKGVSLSGGEKQRLALARGLFFAGDRDSEVILLDESTSSVDVSNERMIYESILGHFKSRVVVSAVHKFNLLDLFDEIIVMEGGKVIERGTLHSLLERGGRFSELWEKYARTTSQIRAVV